MNAESLLDRRLNFSGERQEIRASSSAIVDQCQRVMGGDPEGPPPETLREAGCLDETGGGGLEPAIRQHPGGNLRVCTSPDAIELRCLKNGIDEEGADASDGGRG